MASTVTYGIKSLQQIRVPSKQSAQNSRLVNKISRTNDYFLEKVDPLLGGCISYLLAGLPDDVPQAMLNYFSDLKSGIKSADLKSSDSKWPRKEQKVYLATVIGPIVAKLVNRIAFSRPADVLDFMVTELTHMANDGYTDSHVARDRISMRPDSAPVLTADKPLKSLSPRPAQTNSCSSIPVVPVSRPPRTIRLAVLGLGGSGKTSILNMLQGEPEKKTRPTIGFNPINMMMGTDTTVCFYDLGGGEKIRDIWSQYYYDVHGLLFVVDSAAASGDLQQSAELLQTIIQNPLLLNKPLLLVANKQDSSGCLSVDGVRHVLSTPAVTEHRIVGCNAAVSEDGSTVPNSSAIEGGLEWLLETIHGRFEELQGRVARDTAAKTAEDAAKRLEKERRVLRNKIAAAFPADVDPSLLPPGASPTPDDVFTRTDGLAFLAGEVGVDVNDLPADAVMVGELIGFQRLALQMVGALNVPVSKKKTPLSWNEILVLVRQLRAELGLP